MTKTLFLHDLPANLQRPPEGPLQPIDPTRLFTFNALRRAWLKVRAAGGVAGVDRVSLGDFETNLENHLKQLQQDLLKRQYQPQPVKRLLVPKAGQALRPLTLWTVRDKVVQRLVTDFITPYFERHFLTCSYGFRTGLGVADAVAAVVQNREANRRWVADVDIKDCFDSLDAGLLLHLVKQQIQDPTILQLIQSWLQAKVFNDWHGASQAGASQGNVISPLLANICLHQVDLMLTRQGLHLVRYADDMLICCQRKQQTEQALQVVEAALARVKLNLNQRKSRIVHFDEGFQFLGHFFVRAMCFRL